MEVVFVLLIGILLHGRTGTPRHVGTMLPLMSILCGLMPSLLHLRPKAAIARECARKYCDFLRRDNSSSMSSGVGGPERVQIRWLRSALCNKPKVRLLISSSSWGCR